MVNETLRLLNLLNISRQALLEVQDDQDEPETAPRLERIVIQKKE
jgi:hypothetical protein